MTIPIIGLPKRYCLQCAIEYQPARKEQVICNLCVQALSLMPDMIQAFMARMARRVFELEQRVNATQPKKHRNGFRN